MIQFNISLFELLGSLDYNLMYYAVCTVAQQIIPKLKLSFSGNIIMTKQSQLATK